MNTVSGRILIKETGSGLSGLVVSLLYLDSEVSFNVEQITSENLHLLQKSISLGSDVSDSDGSFCIKYDMEDIGENNQNNSNSKSVEKHKCLKAFASSILPPKRATNHLGLLKQIRFVLVVFAPDSPEKTTEEEILHVSSRIRSKIGRTEKFLIHIPIEQAKSAGILVTWEPEVPLEIVSSAIVKEISNRTTIKHDVDKDIRMLAEERHKFERDKRQNKLKKVKKFMRERVSRRFKMPDGSMADNYVAEGQNITEVNKRVITRSIEAISKSPVRGILALDKNKLTTVLDDNGNIRDM